MKALRSIAPPKIANRAVQKAHLSATGSMRAGRREGINEMRLEEHR
jgi:hypothetical protein